MLKRGAKVDKAGGSSWYVAKSSSGSGRQCVCTLMVMSKGCGRRGRRKSWMIIVVGTTGDEPSHWLVDDGRRSQSDLRQ